MQDLLRKVLAPLMGLGLLVLLWAMVALKSSNTFPSPLETCQQAVTVFSDPF